MEIEAAMTHALAGLIGLMVGMIFAAWMMGRNE